MKSKFSNSTFHTRNKWLNYFNLNLSNTVFPNFFYINDEIKASFGTRKVLSKENIMKKSEGKHRKKIKNKFKLNKLILYVYKLILYIRAKNFKNI